MSDPSDRELGERIGDAWRAEEQPLTPQARVAFDTALYARLEARRGGWRWGAAIAAPVVAICAVLAIAIGRSPDTVPTPGPDLWTPLAAAQATWEATFNDDATDATIQWLAQPSPEAELSELLSSDYQLMAAWLAPTARTAKSQTATIQED